MYYKIVEQFGPQSGDKWQRYLDFRGLKLTKYDSVDGILRPDLFLRPISAEDWQNCVNEDFKLLINNVDYARRIVDRYENSTVVGVEIDLQEGYSSKDGLLGFDIIDGHGSVSLVTNWGTEGIINEHVMANGLLGDFDRALQIRDTLRKKFWNDHHAKRCKLWAVYSTDV